MNCLKQQFKIILLFGAYVPANDSDPRTWILITLRFYILSGVDTYFRQLICEWLNESRVKKNELMNKNDMLYPNFAKYTQNIYFSTLLPHRCSNISFIFLELWQHGMEMCR